MTHISDEFAIRVLRETLPTVGLDLIPYHNFGGLARYLLWGIEPGSFLKAVICNDFMGACGRADADNARHLTDFADIMASIPSGCVGSPQRYDNWIKMNGLLGRCQCGVLNGGPEPHAFDCTNEAGNE